MGKLCPWCGSEMVGEPGERVCVKCMAYEVDTTDPKSYDTPRDKKKLIKMVEENKS